jgi:hypothetical protein
MFDLEDAFLLDLVVLKEPIYIFFIDIADGYCDELGVASIRLGHYFSLEVDQGRFEYKLWIDALALNVGSAFDLH